MNNQPVAGEGIAFSLADWQTGGISFVNDTLGSTTDERGEVHFYYLNRGGGDNVVTVSARGVADSCRITIFVLIIDPPALLLTVNPDTLYVPAGEADSARVDVLLKDPYSIPIVHCNVFLCTNGGLLDFMLLTDSLGQTSTWWHTNGLYGTFYIVAYGCEATDSTWVTVLP